VRERLTLLGQPWVVGRRKCLEYDIDELRDCGHELGRERHWVHQRATRIELVELLCLLAPCDVVADGMRWNGIAQPPKGG